MKKTNRIDIKHVAKLAKLQLTDSEVKKFTKELTSIIGYVKELEEVDTKNTQPISQTTGLVDVTKPDKTDPSRTLPVSAVLSQANKKQGNYFVVPGVLSHES